MGKFFIGIFSLIKCLDHLNAADIFHDGGVHCLVHFDGPLVLFPVIGHHSHHERHSHRDGDKGEERHPPVKDKQIDQNAHRRQYVGRHLRQKVGQRPFHALHLVYDDLLQLAAGGVHDGSQREFRKLGKDTLPDIFQDSKGRFVRHGECERVEDRPQDVASQCQAAPEQIK